MVRNRLEHIAHLERKATPGPWFKGIADGDQLCLHTVSSADAQFIAAARSTAPLLIKLAKQVLAAHMRGEVLPVPVAKTLGELLKDRDKPWRESMDPALRV